MAFINKVMPRRLSSGFQIAPRWSTWVQDMDNGNEIRDQEWFLPKMEGRGNLVSFDDAMREELLAMFMACRGRAHAFRVFNPLDYIATGQPLITIAGVTYLAKSYNWGGEIAYRVIHAPRAGASLSGAGSIDVNTGIVTGAPGGSTWTGQFETWMRFDSDWNPLVATTTRVINVDIDLIEVPRRNGL